VQTACSPYLPFFGVHLCTASSRRILRTLDPQNATSFFALGQAGNQRQADIHAFDLEMWPNQHFHVVETGIVGDVGDLDLGHGQRVLRFGFNRRALVFRHVLVEPLYEFELQVFLFLGSANVLSLDDLQIVRKATHQEEIREACRQP